MYITPGHAPGASPSLVVDQFPSSVYGPGTTERLAYLSTSCSSGMALLALAVAASS
jgi:hypothetical protein